MLAVEDDPCRTTVVTWAWQSLKHCFHSLHASMKTTLAGGTLTARFLRRRRFRVHAHTLFCNTCRHRHLRLYNCLKRLVTTARLSSTIRIAQLFRCQHCCSFSCSDSCCFWGRKYRVAFARIREAEIIETTAAIFVVIHCWRSCTGQLHTHM